MSRAPWTWSSSPTAAASCCGGASTPCSRTPPSARCTVLVVDNDSGDGTVEMVRARVPGGRARRQRRAISASAPPTTSAIRAGRRRVRAGAQPGHAGHRRARSTACSTLMDGAAEVGICGCRLELEDGKPGPRREAVVPDAAERARPLHRASGAAAERAGGSPRTARPTSSAGPVDAVNGAFMLMRRAALDEVGLFDEGYWMYMEDLDLCYRFAQAGWVTWYEPTRRRSSTSRPGRAAGPRAAAQLRLPLRDVPLLPQALRAERSPRSSTRPSTPASP